MLSHRVDQKCLECSKEDRTALPRQLEVEHLTAKPEGKTSTSKNLNSDPAGASTAGDSSQNQTEIVAGGSSGEPSGNPEQSQGGQIGMGVDLQRPPAGANMRTAGVSDTDLFRGGGGSQNPQADLVTDGLRSVKLRPKITGAQRRKEAQSRKREGEAEAPGEWDATPPSSGSVTSFLPKNLTAGSAGGDGRAPGVKRRKNADSTPPADQTARKRPNVEPEIMAARIVEGVEYRKQGGVVLWNLPGAQHIRNLGKAASATSNCTGVWAGLPSGWMRVPEGSANRATLSRPNHHGCRRDSAHTN
ncbi:hypothetical protein TSAR_009389 [Trichomalopsis sarcophagae]|uniref:Uncharacterized protein n=1 Tax=Trichomalopsis sarcophagae TaxID=543379 RepID=A0A232EGP0_9HYME|nr:hypothetical protein TSAR_009389 [Trichomalopsis sarcophagae]